MRRISFMLRQVIACPSLPVTVRLLQGGGGPGSCPQVAGPLSSPAALAGPAAGQGPRPPGRGGGEPGLGGEREGDVPVPGDVLPYLVVVERGSHSRSLPLSP